MFHSDACRIIYQNIVLCEISLGIVLNASLFLDTFNFSIRSLLNIIYWHSVQCSNYKVAHRNLTLRTYVVLEILKRVRVRVRKEGV